MLARIAQWQPDQGAAATARAVGALALAALAVIHVVDLPGTLGPAAVRLRRTTAPDTRPPDRDPAVARRP